MALVVEDLVCISNLAGARLFQYRTADAIATVMGANYFDTAYTRLAAGDAIVVTGSYGGTETVDLVVIDSVSAAGVVVAVNGT